jgi:nucleoside-diphosphate-sugar epimerase
VGAKNQIDAAIKAGVKHFVFLGSMGGTQPDNFLNSIGKREDGTGGDILLWKRKAEKYLIAEAKKAGMAYTIVHPGGLLDKPGGQQELVLDVDDLLLQRTTRSIPREDVATLLVESLLQPKAKNVAFDAIAEPVGTGSVTTDFAALFDSLKGKSCAYEAQ